VAQRAEPAQHAGSLLILKKGHLPELLAGDKVIRTYKVALGNAVSHPKSARATAVRGRVITSLARATRPAPIIAPHLLSQCRRRALRSQTRHRAGPGGAIMIHGLPNGKGWVGLAHWLNLWTLGCVEITNDEIEETWNLVPVGTAVEIRPRPCRISPATHSAKIDLYALTAKCRQALWTACLVS
jgi:hypothetical protein